MGTEERAHFYKQRRGRSIALALALAGVVVLFYVVSLIQGPAILQRPM
ncbi:MAG: CoxF protein [Pseudomonadota bacterium]